MIATSFAAASGDLFHRSTASVEPPHVVPLGEQVVEAWDQHADRLLLIARSIGEPAEDAVREAFVLRGSKVRRYSSCRLSNDRVFVLSTL